MRKGGDRERVAERKNKNHLKLALPLRESDRLRSCMKVKKRV